MEFTRMSEEEKKKFESYYNRIKGEKLHDEVPQAKFFRELMKRKKLPN